MKLTTLVLLTATAAATAVATTIAAPRLTQANTAKAVPMAPVVTAELPTAPEQPAFKPIVRVAETRIEPTHGHLVAELSKCASDACAAAMVANSGMSEVEVAVAMYGDTVTTFHAQLEPGGPFVENPDMNGNGHWDTEDEIKLWALAQDGHE
jgi:hypothetical protein